MSTILVYPNGTVFFNGKEYRCALGKGGMRKDKQEGDGATPVGVFTVRNVYYRPDKFSKTPITVLPTTPLTETDGWSTDSHFPEYNKRITLPYDGSCEELWRADDIYDIIVPLGYNDDPPVLSKGSAIFMHIAREHYSPTEGCVALAKGDILEILESVNTETQVNILE